MQWALHKVVFELRFPASLWMWDRAGKVAVSVQGALPDWEVSEGTPAKVELSHSKSSAKVTYTPTSLATISPFNPGLKQFAEESGKVANIVLEALEVRVLNRIGNRFKFVQRRDNAEVIRQDIVKFLQARGLTYGSFVQEPGQQPDKAPTEFIIRFEHEGSGVMLHLDALVIAPETAAGLRELYTEYPKVLKPQHCVEADFDVYQNGPIQVDSCSASDIITGNNSMLESQFLAKLKV